MVGTRPLVVDPFKHFSLFRWSLRANIRGRSMMVNLAVIMKTRNKLLELFYLGEE